MQNKYKKYSFEELILNEMEIIYLYEEILEDLKKLCNCVRSETLEKDLKQMLRNKWAHIYEIQKMTGLEVVTSEDFSRRWNYNY